MIHHKYKEDFIDHNFCLKWKQLKNQVEESLFKWLVLMYTYSDFTFSTLFLKHLWWGRIHICRIDNIFTTHRQQYLFDLLQHTMKNYHHARVTETICLPICLRIISWLVSMWICFISDHMFQTMGTMPERLRFKHVHTPICRQTKLVYDVEMAVVSVALYFERTIPRCKTLPCVLTWMCNHMSIIPQCLHCRGVVS